MSTAGNETESPVEAGRDAEEEQVDTGEHEGGRESDTGLIDAGSSAEGLVAAEPTPVLPPRAAQEAGSLQAEDHAGDHAGENDNENENGTGIGIGNDDGHSEGGNVSGEESARAVDCPKTSPLAAVDAAETSRLPTSSSISSSSSSSPAPGSSSPSSSPSDLQSQPSPPMPSTVAAADGLVPSKSKLGDADQPPRVSLRQELQKRRPSVYRIRKICRDGLGCRIPAQCRSDVWQLLLGTESKDRFLLDDSIRDTKQDLENQRVIRVDAQRTRADVEIFRTEEMQLLVSRLLTFYCKRKGIKYKQGLNEVLAPFIMLRRDPPLPDGTVFNMFYAFIERFLPHSFVHEDFHALQCSFRLFRLLLLYHDPELCNFLDTHSLSPELYATPWFLTLFARNVPLKVLYQLWDTYLLEEEDHGPHLHMFVALALTLENRTGILETHPSDLPIYLTSVLGPNATSPNTAAEDLAQSTPYLYDSSWMARLIVRARKLRAHTPTHFTETFSRALLSPKLPTLAFLERLENQSCLHMSASQLLGLVTNRDRMRDENEFIVRVVDCRSREDFEQEHVIGSLHLDPELLNLPDLLSEAMESLADRLQLTDLSLHLVVVGPSSACSPTPSPSVTPTSFAESGGLERSRANSGMAPDLAVAPAEEDQSAVLFVLHAIQRKFSKVSILEGGWDAVARDPEVGAVLESGASIDELVDPDVLRQKTRAPIHTWRESGMETLRGALSMDSFGSVTEPSAGSASAGQNASRKAASGSSPSWYQQLSSRIGDAAPLGALFSTSSISSTSSGSSQVPGDTEETDVASSKGDDTTSLASSRLSNTPKVSDPSTRKQMQRDQEGAKSAGAAADGTAPKIASAASAFVSRVANRYFTKTSEGAAKANSKAGPKDLLELALLAHDSESQWLDIEEWTSQTEGSGVDAQIFAAARLTLDLDGCKRSTECTLAVTKSRLVELRAHPDRSSFACVQEVHEISRLIKITSKKKRREIVFHFKVGPNGVKQRSFIIEKAGECIDIVKRRFSDLSQAKPRTK